MQMETRRHSPPDSQALIAMTVQHIEAMRREIQASVFDAVMTANRDFLDSRLKQDDFALAHEIACVLKDGLSLAEVVLDHLKTSAETDPTSAIIRE